MKIHYAIIFVCALSVAGCGTRAFTDRETNPVTEDYIREDGYFGRPNYAVLSTRPDRRSVFVNLSRSKASNYLDFCAEPPADVAEAFARSQSAAITNVEVDGGSQSLALANSLSTAIGQLTRRSQGLQFMRDQMFYLCVERMNGTISDLQYAQMRSEVVRLSAEMVNGELATLPSTLTSIAAVAQAEASIAESKAAVEADKGSAEQSKPEDKK